MSLRNALFDQEQGDPRGLDTTSPIATMPDNTVRVAQNVSISLSGGYSKRLGYTNRATSVWTGRSITAGIEYEGASNVVQTIIFGTDGSPTGGIIGDFDPSGTTPISSGLSGTARLNFLQFNSLLFAFNGVNDPILYDGVAPRQVGITAPTVAPTENSQTTGGELVPLSSYVYAYTYYNSVTGAESSPSELLTVVLTGANNRIIVGITPGSAVTADTIRIYRTFANGNALFLDGTTAISATSFDSNQKDAGLGVQMEFDNSRITDLTSSAQFPTVADNRIFIRTGDNEMRFSKIGQSGPMPESYEAKSFVPTVGRFGMHDKLVGVNRINQLVIALKNNSIGRLDPIGLPDSTISRDNVSYQYREISDAVGALNHGGACQVYDELIFIARENLYATNGINVRPIANPIQATIKALGTAATQRTKISAINDLDNRKVYFCVFASSTSALPSLILVGDYQLYPDFRWSTFEPGPNASTHPGITAGCFFTVTNTTTGRNDIYFGNNKLNGKLYRMNDGNNDDSSAIYMKIITRPYENPDHLLWKLYKKVEMHAAGNGNNYNIRIAAIYNLTGVEEEAQDLSLFTSAALYDALTSLYDTSMYADSLITDVEYFMHRKAKHIQLVFYQTGADQPLDIYQWGIYASAFNPNEGPQGIS